MQNLDHRRFIWILDRDDRIIRVNDNWLAFAQENLSPHLMAALVLDQFIWQFITGPETVYLYEQIFRRVRAGVSPVALPFRCDSPDCRRYMEMSLALLPGEAIEFTAHILREERRAPVALLDVSRARSGELLSICSWCKAVYIPGRGWGEIEAAIEALDLFGGRPMPQLTHAVCNTCYETIIQELNLG
jgi:hypothetical protein